MNSFLLDDSGSAEAGSSVILIAAVGLLVSLAFALYWGAFNTFFSNAGDAINGIHFGG